ncbi:MAG: AAA family ATPase [Proteobacteria bacterium]|nr:AAA family ATPase [Pseudomonadota bacterium]
MSLFDPTYRLLRREAIDGMAEALEAQNRVPDIAELSFEDRLAMLLDAEMTRRTERSYQARLRQAQLRIRPTLEEVSCKSGRGLSRSVLTHLATGDWIRKGNGLIIEGKTGVGKTFLACALAHQACRQLHSVLYRRAGDLLAEIAAARVSNRLAKLQRRLARVDLLAIDDFGLASFTAEGRRDLLDVVERRERGKSTLVASQVPSDRWHAIIGEPTIADAIVDRLVNSAYRIQLDGPSMREREALPALEEVAVENAGKAEQTSDGSSR